MGMKLSHSLINLGFFSALGTTEHAGPSGKEIPVKVGRQNTYDCNNGVVVVYDENGCPWIRAGRIGYGYISHHEMETTLREFSLVRGAYVPHSNDGGYFVREVMPNL